MEYQKIIHSKKSNRLIWMAMNEDLDVIGLNFFEGDMEQLHEDPKLVNHLCKNDKTTLSLFNLASHSLDVYGHNTRFSLESRLIEIIDLCCDYKMGINMN